jgi:hypothetical protein
MAAEKEILATIQSHFGGAISGHLCSRTSDILVAPSWSKNQRGAIRLAYPGVKALRLKSNKSKAVAWRMRAKKQSVLVYAGGIQVSSLVRVEGEGGLLSLKKFLPPCFLCSCGGFCRVARRWIDRQMLVLGTGLVRRFALYGGAKLPLSATRTGQSVARYASRYASWRVSGWRTDSASSCALKGPIRTR